MTLPTTTSINGCDDDSDMFGPPRSSPPIGYHHHRSRVPMISPKLRQREERKRILQLCAHKLERIKDSETNLRRSVCINNTYCRLTDELRREKQSRYLANLPRTESKPESARENIFNPYNACGNDSNNRQTIPNKTHNDINGNTQCQTLANSTTLNSNNNNNNTTTNNNYNPAATTPNTPTTTTTLTIANQPQRNSYNNDVHAGHNHNNHHHHNNNNSHSQNNNNNNDNLNSTKLCNGTNNNNNSQQQQQSQQCQHHHHHQQQQHQQLPNHIPSRKRQLSSNNLHNDLEILDRELSAIDAPMPLIDPEITQGAEQLEKAISSRKRLRSEDESDRLVREALSQFYIPPQRLISAIEDCPLDVVSLGGVGNCGQMAMNLNGNMMSTMHTKRQKMSNDLELDFDMNQNQKDFEVIMDALRLGTPSPTPSMGSVDSCGQAAMMSESASVFHNLVVTSLET